MPCHIIATKQTTTWHYIYQFSLFKIHPHLNFLAVPNWLTVQLYYLLIGPEVKILNMVSPLAANYLTPFPML